jgi:hypothetical protein
MKNFFPRIIVFSFLLLPTTALALVNVTPDITFSGNDVFQSTTVNIPIPSGITTGMVMFIVITFDDNQTGTISITGNTSSTAWTSFGTVYSTTPNKYAFYKVADAGDAADSAAGGRSWTLHCSDGFIEQWAGAAWSGVNTSNPFATGPSIDSSNATTFSFTSQTSPGSSAVWVGLTMIENNSNSVTDPSSPVVNQEQSTSPYYFGPGIVYSATGITGAFAPTGTEANGFEWATVAFFLNPASAGGGPTGRIIRIIGGTRLIGGIRLGG